MTIIVMLITYPGGDDYDESRYIPKSQKYRFFSRFNRMLPVHFHSWIAIAAVIFVFLGLQFRRGAPTDLLFLLALVGVTLAGVITPQDAFRGFSNPALLTIAALLVVAAGLRSSGVLDWIGKKMLGSVETERGALLRLVP